MTLMDQHKANEEAISALAAVCYLVSLVLPIVPVNVQRSSFFQSADVMAACLHLHTTTGTTSMNKALVESLGVLLVAQEPSVWSEPATGKMFNLLLQTTADPRPKIRHRAVDTCARILKNPPFPLQIHPSAQDTANVLKTRLLESVTEKDSTTTIHTLSLLVRVISYLPAQSVKSTCEAVLRVLQSGQAQANQLCFQAFQALFAAGTDSTISPELGRQLVLALFEYKPNVNDVELYSSWLNILTRAAIVIMQLNEEIGLSLVPQISTLLAEPLSADNSSTWNIATKCVNELIAHVCIPAKNASNGESDSVDRKDTEDMDMNVDVSINSARRHEMAQMFASQLKEMLGFKCARVWNLVLDVIGCTYGSMGKSATPVMDGVFSAAVQLYATPEFHARQSMMAMVGKACKAIGPEALFTVRPLDIDASVATDEFPWAWLLVAINGNVERTELAYFATTMLPLATDMGVMAEQLKEKSGHAEQAATYHKIHRQIWSLFTGFCTRPTDVCASFPLMARTLGEVIRQRPDLRVLVCDGLRTIIETTCMSKKSLRVGVVGLVEGEADPHAADRAAVAKFAKNFLPLLFNAYAESTSQEMKASVLKCLERYAAIADPQLVNTFFANVMKKLLQSSAATPDSMDTNNDTTRRTVEQTAQMHTMMNLAFALLNYLNADSLGLYYKVLCPQLLDRDPTLQKLSYQSLCAVWDPNAPKMPHQEFAAVHRADLREALSGSYLAVAGAAKKQRLRILSLLVDQASPFMHGASELEIIPAAVTEAILSTKEVNEKTRELAYRLLVTMGTAMIRAEEAQATFVNPMGERVPASLDELILMIVAGLGGTTPHMISASVMSLGRLFFEFSTQLAPAKRDELLQTMLMMLKTKNREIAKSMLAFFKICIVCVPPQVLGQYLPTLLDTLMGWPDDQKQHFKMKIRFLLERLIRKYGLEEITNMMPEKDRKLVANIRKRKEQDLRKQREEKDARREYAESKNPLGAPVGAAKTKAQSFEDILYGADSDDSDAEDDGNSKTAKKEAEGATWLKGDTADGESEDVLDFLDASAVNRMVTTDPARMGRRQKAHWSEYDADGKMLVEDPEAENGDEEDGDSDNAMEIQDTKRIKGQKRNRDNTFDMSGDQDDEDKKDWNRSKRGGAKHNAGKNDTEGQQYGSKKASGDMRRKGNKFEPFAYVALDKKNINKRHTNKAAGTFKAVMSKKHKRN